MFKSLSMSVDGFITGPNDDVKQPLGVGGDRLHQWVYDLASWREPHGLAGGKTNRDSEILEESFKAAGSFLMGRRMYNLGERYWVITRRFTPLCLSLRMNLNRKPTRQAEHRLSSL